MTPTNETATSLPATAETNPPDVLTEARAALRSRWLAERAAERAESLALASQAYDAYQDSVRQKWMASWIASNTPAAPAYPYDEMTDAEAYRCSLDRDVRIAKLIAAGMWAEAVKCFVFRNSCRVPLAEVRSWLESHGFGATAGCEEIVCNKITQATGVSAAFRKLIRDAGLDVSRGEVLFAVRYTGKYSDTPILANHPAIAEQYPPEEY
jgi:hypothetical protein